MQYLVFDGILFQGSNMEGIYLLGASNITFTNCKIRFSGLDGIKAIQSNYIMIANTTVEYSNNNGIDLDGSRNTIQDSRIARSGAFPGMGNVSHSYQGITITGNNNTVQYNMVDTTGYSALVFTGVSNIIQNNLVDYFNFVKDDGGGIYTWSGDIDSATRRSTGLVTANIVLNGVTACAGTDNSVAGIAHGIYLDENTGVANVSGNTVAHCTAGIFIQDAHEITVSGNTFFDNTGQIIIRHSQVTGTLRNNEITNNIGVSNVDSQNVLVMSSIASVTSLPSFAYMHANKYAQISGNSFFFRTAMQDENNSGSLALWKSPRYNKDWNSVQLPVNIPSYIVEQLTGENLYTKGAIITPFSQAVNDNRVIVSTPVGAIQSGASYVTHFTLYSPDNTHTLLVFLQKYSPPYTHLTPVMNVTTGMPSTSNTIVMNTTGSDPDASIVFQMNQSDPRVSIGNIDLYAADVTPYDPDQNVLFQYNASKSVLTIPLNGVYQDAGGRTYQGNVQLQPYTSVLLIKNFTAQAPPSPCNIPYISTVKPLGGGSVNVTWDGVSGAASYNIKFVNGAYTKEFSNYVPAGSSPYSFNFSGLPASNYVISIQANCSSGQISAWGSYFSSVQINSVGGSISDVASKDTITVDKGDVFTLYPVPSSSQVNIFYDAEQSGKADIIIMNELGSTLIRRTVGVTAGQNNYPINVSQFANGVYIVKLIAGNYIHVQKLVVRK
jgi:parallel beta-helix repeat protein